VKEGLKILRYLDCIATDISQLKMSSLIFNRKRTGMKRARSCDTKSLLKA